MNKHFIRLVVALAAFSLGLILTGFLRPARRVTRTQINCMHRESTIITPGAAEAEILDIYRQYGPAQTRHDRNFFERIETADFTLTAHDLNMSREEDIRWMEEQPTDIVYEIKVDHLRVSGNLAMASGYLEISSPNGEIRHWPFADVWVNRTGTWQIHSTTSQ